MAHYLRMIAQRYLLVLCAAVASTGIAHAAPVDTPSGTVISLSPEQVEAAKEAAAERNMKAAALGIDTSAQPDRRPHGEVGVAVGTGGYRSIYGSTVMPLGKDGVLALSFENTQNNPYYYGYGYGYGLRERYRR